MLFEDDRLDMDFQTIINTDEDLLEFLKKTGLIGIIYHIFNSTK